MIAMAAAMTVTVADLTAMEDAMNVTVLTEMVAVLTAAGPTAAWNAAVDVVEALNKEIDTSVLEDVPAPREVVMI